MQTREPGKRVNWIFVFVLIITIPLIIFTLFMMNTIPSNPPVTSTYDSTKVGINALDTLVPDTSTAAWQDSTLENN